MDSRLYTYTEDYGTRAEDGEEARELLAVELNKLDELTMDELIADYGADICDAPEIQACVERAQAKQFATWHRRPESGYVLNIGLRTATAGVKIGSGWARELGEI